MVLLGLAVLVSSAGIDYSHARYVQALTSGARWRAAGWSVGQWGAGTVGFVVAIKVSLWLLPCEAAGLYLGTVLAIPRRASVVDASRDCRSAETIAQIEKIPVAILQSD